MEGFEKMKIITLSGASGSGKTSIVQKILAAWDGVFLIPSMTTRAKRVSDVAGEYVHITKEEFSRRKELGEFLEYDNPHGDWYGTLRSSFEQARDSRHLGLKAISPEGAQAFYSAAPEIVLPLYILPPPEGILKERLTKRGESQERIERRLEDCQHWYAESQLSPVLYKYIANHFNDGDFSHVLKEIRQHLIAHNKKAVIVP